MITPDEALARIGSRVRPLPPRRLPLAAAAGCSLAADLVALVDLPPFANSAVDGYAVRARDLLGASRERPVTLRLRGEAAAGTASRGVVGEGEAVRILTGAPIPAGADAIVMQEESEAEDGVVRILHSPEPADFLRPAGEDTKRDEELLAAGTLLRPYEIGLLSAQGVAEVEVVPRPRAAVIATGSELVAPGSPLGPGQIYDANSPSLCAALARWGVASRNLGAVADDPEAIAASLRKAAQESDLLLVSGGVSVGDYDCTRRALDGLGFEEIFWKVAIKPGKPLLFGRLPREGGGESWVFGLPGNPVSALVCAEEFVRPAVERLRGLLPAQPGYPLAGHALGACPKPRDRRQYVFCRAVADGAEWGLEIVRPQGSALLKMASRANALAIAEAGVALVREGDLLPFRWLE